MPVSTPHMENLLKQHWCDLVCVQLSQSRPHNHMSVPPKWEHILCAQLQPTRDVLVLPLREHTIRADPRAGTGFFPKPRALVLPVVKFGQSKPDGLGYIDTVDSVLMHHQYRLSVLQWNPGPARRNPTKNIAAAKRKVPYGYSFKKPVIMSRTSLISSLHALATRTSPCCSTRTPSNPTLWFSPTRRTPRAKVRGVWPYSSFEAYCDAIHILVHR